MLSLRRCARPFLARAPPARPAERPRPPTVWQTLLLNLVCAAACIIVVAIIDFVLSRFFVGRYFALHTVVNVVICVFAAPDALRTLFAENPYDTNTCVAVGSTCAALVTIDLTIALHVWHALAYALKPIDWVHHLPTYLVCLVALAFPWGPVLNFVLFFALMGIPGGIDYALLTAVKQRWTTPRVEKDWNQTLNVWLRCPFAVISGYIILMGAVTTPAAFLGPAHRTLHALTGVHNAWNGCFFMYRTVESRTRYADAMDKKGAEKAPAAAARRLV